MKKKRGVIDFPLFIEILILLAIGVTWFSVRVCTKTASFMATAITI